MTPLALWLLGALATPAQAAPTQAAPSPARLALVIGIDRYAHLRPLRGAVADAQAMQALLVGTYGFPPDAVTLLTDEDATRDGMIAALEAFAQRVEAAGPDPLAVLYFSGHGSQRASADPAEVDGLDETWVPVDSGHADPHENRDLTDDELGALLARLARHTRRLTVVVDACHAGALTRSTLVRARALPPDRRPPPTRPAPFGAGPADADGFWAQARGFALLAASRSDELALEARVNGRTRGLFTWHLTRLARAARTPMSHRALARQLAAQVSAHNPRQHPVALGDGLDRAFLGEGVGPTAPARVDATGTHLDVGALHGVRAGDLFLVDGTPPARIKLREPGPGATAFDALDGPPAPGAAAHPLQPDVGGRIPVAVTDPPARRALADSPLVVPAPDDGGAPLRVARDGLGWAVQRGTPPVQVDHAATPAELRSALERWARWLRVAALTGPSDRRGVQVRVLDPSGQAAPDVLRPGRAVVLQVRNGGRLPVYVVVLALGEDGSVGVLHPRSGAVEALAPGREIRRTLKAALPPGRARTTDRLKVLLTEAPVDLWALRQAAPRGPQDPSWTAPWAPLLVASALGPRKVVPLSRAPRPLWWATVDQALVTER